MMNKHYTGLKYDSDKYKEIFEGLDKSKNFYLINMHDKPHYAYMSWRMHSENQSWKYKEMGEGFFVSSIILLENCLDENRDRKGDAVIFPILFNVEHAIELYIKALIYLVGENGITTNMRMNKHSIKEYINELNLILSSCDTAMYDIACHDFDYLNQFLDYFFDETYDFTYARYPFNTSNHAQFYVDSNDNYIVDMKILLDWIKSIFYILDKNFITLSIAYEQRGDNENEI